MFFSSTEQAPSQNSDFDVVSRTHVVLRLDSNYTILDVNEKAEACFGYSASELIGASYKILLRDVDENWIDSTLQPAVRAGTDLKQIGARLNKAGNEVWLDSVYSRLGNADGETSILVVGSDITEYHLRRRDNRGHTDAVFSTMAVIEFDLDGTILNANDHFLTSTGYQIDEIRGKKHRIFMDPVEANTKEYQEFWQRLSKGSSEVGVVKRTAKNGDILWLRATYDTLYDGEGRPFKVVKYAFDITEDKNAQADAASKIQAIGKVQAVIEFTPDGTIVSANDNFCNVMGYSESEIVGKHHRMFVDPEFAGSPEYRDFWLGLKAGEVKEGQYKRFGKSGRTVYVRASYNPIRDAAGRVVKIVKFALDATKYQLLAETMAHGLKCLSEGDLSVRLDQNLEDMDQIRVDFNSAVEHLEFVIAKVVEQSGEINTESETINAATKDLAKLTEQQAATLEESAASLEQISNLITNTAEEAKKANGQTAQTKLDTEESSEIVRATVQAVDEIAGSSKKIASITSVIDDIAFQTNLLALNAGVEAARAGTAGRGFSVVASEVRALAQRSSEAAKEIAGLISTSEKQVDKGVDLVRKTGEALDKITHATAQIHISISHISQSAVEQATRVSGLNNAIDDLDRATQHNAAMAEETSASAQSLRTAVAGMHRDVGFFDKSSSSASTLSAERAEEPFEALCRSA